MTFIQNTPALSILMIMFSAVITSVVGEKTARKISIAVTAINIALSFALLSFLTQTGTSYVYVMGHVPAPWGNELRAGMLEAAMALFLCFIMLFALLGGGEESKNDLEKDKPRYYYIMLNMLLAANLALVYTNDLFTAYVFVEINTIAACGAIIAKKNDLTITAGVRYMIMNLVGSGLFLLGVCFIYYMTGHLLMSNIKEQIAVIAQSGLYKMPLLLSIGIVCAGLGIKSALWPFHSWVPGAYGCSTVTSQCALSSIVSKGYIFLLIKIVYRVVGFEIFAESQIVDVLFVFGIIGMVLGSVEAIRQRNLLRMIAYSSVAQIGYIYMGIGMGSAAGVSASIYHIFAHSAAKSLVFVAASGLIAATNGEKEIGALYASGFRNKIAGVGFTIGALSMIGVPGLGGFISKLMFATASLQNIMLAVPVLIALAVSTILNTVYFMRVVLRIYTPVAKARYRAPHIDVADFDAEVEKSSKNAARGFCFNTAVIGLAALNVFLGIYAGPLVQIVRRGLEIFG